MGPRGIGKTRLLRYLQTEAEQVGFRTVWVTAGDGPFLQSVTESFHRLSTEWKETARTRITDLLQTLTVTVEEAVTDGAAGFVLFIDEIQSADVEGLRALAYAWQHMQSEAADLPAITAAAGLSHSQDVITDAVSFAERFRYPRLKDLDDVAARSELTAPTTDCGVIWDDDALVTALDEARGYPYFLQLLGDETWKAARYPDSGSVIGTDAVSSALDDYRTSQRDFFRARWMKATDAETAMLVAMASLRADTLRRKDIAARMGRTSNEISMVRRSLMDKGLIQSTGFGELSFTAPGFAEFVRAESDAES